MDGLVGYTGFVGGNLLLQHKFTGRFNRANISELEGRGFRRLVVAAAPAAMWMANSDPAADRENILTLFESLRQAKTDRLILISTIAVYRDSSLPVDEASNDFEIELPYGRHRRELETRVQNAFPNSLIVRLPALVGQGLKKNFVFDIKNPVPSFLKPDLFERLCEGLKRDDSAVLGRAFEWDGALRMHRFLRDEYTDGAEGKRVKTLCTQANISAMVFTHSQSQFQFYDLANLWPDLMRADALGLSTLNLATEPLSANDIYQHIFGKRMPYDEAPIVHQDMRTMHSAHWGRSDGYVAGRESILSGICDMIGDVT